MKILTGIILLVLSLPSCGMELYKSILFDRGAEGHLKRAADANTIHLAKQELQTTLEYLEKNNLTNGYTSILYQTPDEDVGFWYTNLKSSLSELKSLSDNVPPLERSNMLMKLRETILDEGKNTSVTIPSGIHLFPNNIAYAIWVFISIIIGCIGGVMIFMGIDDL